jgi:uncharacterized protein (DUF427 family)
VYWVVAAERQVQVFVKGLLVSFHIQKSLFTETHTFVQADVHKDHFNRTDRPGQLDFWDQGVEKV